MKKRNLIARLGKLEAPQSRSPNIPGPTDAELPTREERQAMYRELVDAYRRADFPPDRATAIVCMWNDTDLEDFAEEVLERIEGLSPESRRPIENKLLEILGDIPDG